MGGAVTFLATSGGDRKLQDTGEIVRGAARVARARALQTGARQIVRFDADQDKRQAVDGQKIPQGVRIDVWRPGYGKEEWRQAGDFLDGPMKWEFTGGGLVEPIRLRLVHGENIEILSFNALTGEAHREAPETR